MSEEKVTYWEAVVISWRRELKLGDPWRIARLTFWTVWLTLVHYLIAIKWFAYNAFWTVANFLVRAAIVVIRALKGDTDWRK